LDPGAPRRDITDGGGRSRTRLDRPPFVVRGGSTVGAFTRSGDAAVVAPVHVAGTTAPWRDCGVLVEEAP